MPSKEWPRPEAHVERLRALVNEALPEVAAEAEPAALYAPVRYVLAGEGKRLRPVLLLLVAEAYGAASEDALPAALAVEAFHNFTLVHDDIMDHADTRRGRPTTHVRWDESTAILAGDLLLGRAYELLSRTEGVPLRRLLPPFHRMMTRLCEGQARDKAFETRADVSVADYLRMIEDKTGALLELVFVLGGLIGQAGGADVEALRAAGGHLGRAFQIQDDLLDLTAEDTRWGKQIGGDLVEGKKTLLLLRALEQSEGAERAWFARIVEGGGLPPAEVAEARDRMRRLGVLQEAEAAVKRHSRAALKQLSVLPDGPAARTTRRLIQRMQARGH